MRRGVADAGVLAIVSALWSRKIVALWWTFDDPFHLNFIAPRSAGQLLFSSETWRAYPAHVFTPLHLLSLRADLYFAGANARGFYLHHLVSFVCIAPLLYILLRQWLGRVPAICSALIAMAGVPMTEAAQRLMDRHYLEGLLFALLSTLLFVVAIRSGARKWSVGSAALYLVAMSAKEIFVPLVAILAVLPEGDARKRLRGLLPHAFALLVYAAWRFAALGPRLESYGWAVKRADWPRMLATLPLRMAGVLAHGAIAGWLSVALIAAAVAIVAWQLRPARRLIAVGACAALLPIVPVSFEIQPRYGLAAWVLAAAAVGFVPRRGWMKALPLIVVAVAVIAGRQAWADSYRAHKQMSGEARALAALGPQDMLWLPATPPATLDELARLTGTRARWTYAALPLCAGRLSAERFWGFDAAARNVRQMRREELLRSCAANRAAPLSVRFEATRGALFWDFGPYETGTYRIVIADGRQGFDVPRRAGFQLSGIPALPLRVRYQSPDGWTTYSDDLQVSLLDGRNASWQRSN